MYFFIDSVVQCPFDFPILVSFTHNDYKLLPSLFRIIVCSQYICHHMTLYPSLLRAVFNTCKFFFGSYNVCLPHNTLNKKVHTSNVCSAHIAAIQPKLQLEILYLLASALKKVDLQAKGISLLHPTWNTYMYSF